jgi:CHAD domain-containing protein
MAYCCAVANANAKAMSNPAALSNQLKQVQDAIGLWHDRATLEQLAASHMDSPDAASARVVLHTRASREYRHARRTTQSVRSWMMRAPLTVSRAPAVHEPMRKAG